jgi:hypothetical protein
MRCKTFGGTILNTWYEERAGTYARILVTRFGNIGTYTRITLIGGDGEMPWDTGSHEADANHYLSHSNKETIITREEYDVIWFVLYYLAPLLAAIIVIIIGLLTGTLHKIDDDES